MATKLRSNNEIVKVLWSTVKKELIEAIKDGDHRHESVFLTSEYNGILSLENREDFGIVPVDCYGADNDGNEFEFSEDQLDDLYLEIKKEGHHYVDLDSSASYDQDEGFDDYYTSSFK
jgi:hypothetical protein